MVEDWEGIRVEACMRPGRARARANFYELVILAESSFSITIPSVSKSGNKVLRVRFMY